MKSLVALLLSIAVAMLSWGVYGPVLQKGQAGMDGSTLKPFICVGMAYFLIAVLAPAIALKSMGEAGRWTPSGIIWSLVAGAVGALAALGIILALAFRGSPVYVMPLVFGCAPVVNTFLTMYWGKLFRHINPVFIAGLIIVVLGAVTVLIFRPHGHAGSDTVATTEKKDGVTVDITKQGEAEPTHYQAASREALQVEHPEAYKLFRQHARLTAREFMLVMLFTAMTALCWGVYGPTLHRGQTGMAGSRLRPLICVGLAYFLIAVIVPTLLLAAWDEPGRFTPVGTIWSLLGGAAGAAGHALGIIMAFNFGGRPIFVMPLVFGGAPVINTFVSLVQTGNYNLHPVFYAGLLLVAAGAVTVLVFAPKPAKHGPSEPAVEPVTEPKIDTPSPVGPS